MEELFKSLSESVSEECFDDILGIVEELLNENTGDAIDKKYPKGTRENGILRIKAQNARLKNFHDMDQRGVKNSKWSSQDRAYGADTKNAVGMSKTNLRRHKVTSRQLEN